jgi:hypothetical protein
MLHMDSFFSLEYNNNHFRERERERERSNSDMEQSEGPKTFKQTMLIRSSCMISPYKFQ